MDSLNEQGVAVVAYGVCDFTNRSVGIEIPSMPCHDFLNLHVSSHALFHARPLTQICASGGLIWQLDLQSVQNRQLPCKPRMSAWESKLPLSRLPCSTLLILLSSTKIWA